MDFYIAAGDLFYQLLSEHESLKLHDKAFESTFSSLKDGTIEVLAVLISLVLYPLRCYIAYSVHFIMDFISCSSKTV